MASTAQATDFIKDAVLDSVAIISMIGSNATPETPVNI